MKKSTNTKSIVSLTLGILSIILPYIGLILGVIGIVISSKSVKEINLSSEQGRGLAIAGKVCSIVGICIQILWLFLAILGYASFFMLEDTNVQISN